MRNYLQGGVKDFSSLEPEFIQRFEFNPALSKTGRISFFGRLGFVGRVAKPGALNPSRKGCHCGSFSKIQR
jgi:hypothetical protein